MRAAMWARTIAAVVLVLAFAFATSGIAAEATEATAPSAQARALSIANKPWTGDFDAALKRRMIRVLVPYSRSLYFNDKGTERGLTADVTREFERYVNKQYKTGKRPLTVYIVPTTRDKLLPNLVNGLGDIAAGNLTVTEERQRKVDFVVQGSRVVKEVVVTGSKAPPVTSLDALSSVAVYVRHSSSYYESLVALNESNKAAGKPEVRLVVVPDALEDEDMMEMANAGIIDALIVDDWKAKVWAQVLPKIVVHDDLAVRDDGRIGWAIRKNSPGFEAAIRDFYPVAKKSASYEYRLAQAMRRVRQMKDPTQSAAWKQFQEMLALFERYGAKYNFDPLMLAAQGYQESQLNQNAKSHVGAIGVMQLMPGTGAEMKVGDIHVTEANIHAGTKYMDILMTKYFPDAHFSEGNRPLFAFASYNAGPGNISRMRKEAVKRNLDPDKWFNNVEVVVAEKIGMETTTYVRNIYKYYVAYKLTLEAHEVARKAREQTAPAAN